MGDDEEEEETPAGLGLSYVLPGGLLFNANDFDDKEFSALAGTVPGQEFVEAEQVVEDEQVGTVKKTAFFKVLKVAEWTGNDLD